MVDIKDKISTAAIGLLFPKGDLRYLSQENTDLAQVRFRSSSYGFGNEELCGHCVSKHRKGW